MEFEDVTYVTFDTVKFEILHNAHVQIAYKTTQCTCIRTHSCGILAFMCYSSLIENKFSKDVEDWH